MVELKVPAVIVASLIPMIVGMIWYSPVLFLKPWLKAMDWSPAELEAMKRKSMGSVFGFSYAAALVQSVALAIFAAQLGADSFGVGAWLGVWIGVGFAAASSVSSTLFEHRSMLGWFINSLYNVACFALMGGLLGAWR